MLRKHFYNFKGNRVRDEMIFYNFKVSNKHIQIKMPEYLTPFSQFSCLRSCRVDFKDLVLVPFY